jgi:hypothetical protein
MLLAPLLQQLMKVITPPLTTSTPMQVSPLGQQTVPVGVWHAWLLGQHEPLTQVCPLGQQVMPQAWLLGQHCCVFTHTSPLLQQVVYFPVTLSSPQAWLVGQQPPAPASMQT